MTWTRLKELVETPLSGLTQPTRSDWIFALRTVSAGLIALLAAYALKLDHPQWAMMTVFIVAQPVAGMVLAKGFYRLLGTLAGGLAAIGITTVFGTGPWLLVTALAVWIGLCTLVSSLLRNPEAYGAALAGYTAMIIGLPAFGQPHFEEQFGPRRRRKELLLHEAKGPDRSKEHEDSGGDHRLAPTQTEIDRTAQAAIHPRVVDCVVIVVSAVPYEVRQ